MLRTPFIREAVDSGTLLDAGEVSAPDVAGNCAGALASRRLPFTTDPREWSFEMRKDAALLTLDLSRDALAAGFEMKDASAFNVLFEGCRPRFIDHGSFRSSFSGHWPGYSQFGDHFMNPLLLEAHAGLTTADTPAGIHGIPVGVATASIRGRGRLGRGWLSWIWRRTLAERGARRASTDTGERLSRAHLPVAAVDRIQDKASRVIRSLRSSARSIWNDYEAAACPYDQAQTSTKRRLVDEWCKQIGGGETALDVGCNVGTYSKILAEHFERVIAVDNDSVAIDGLYRRGSTEAWGTRVTPAVVDLTEPTPAVGWRNRERASFLERLGQVDLSIWLAIVHHLVLTGGIPLSRILALAGSLSRHAIVEHIDAEDISVRTMTAGRRWTSMPTADEFRTLLQKQGFTVLRSEQTSPSRTLVLLKCPG